jgi:hypothetical protein
VFERSAIKLFAVLRRAVGSDSSLQNSVKEGFEGFALRNIPNIMGKTPSVGSLPDIGGGPLDYLSQ